jgi:dipeptidyl aminopeptidase/acylaminoacyl peptidase
MGLNRILVVVFCLACFGFSFASMRAADENKSSSKTEPWKAEDIINTETVQQFRISPDGKLLAWVQSESDKEKDARVSNLYLASLTENHEIQLTRGPDTNSSFAWSPDSEWIAFLSTKPRPQAKPDTAHSQIWLINSHAGEPYPLTDFVRAPHEVDWIDKDTIIFSAQEDPSAYEQALKKKKDDSEAVDDSEHEPPVRLFKMSVKDKKVTRLTNNTDWIRNWSVSEDGKYVVASHAKSLHYTFDQKVPPATILHNLTDGSEKQILTEGRIRPYRFDWTPDSSGFYVSAPFSNDPKFLTASITLLYFYDLASGKSAQVPLDWENGIGSGVVPVKDGLIVSLAAGARFETVRYTREKSDEGFTWKRAALEGEHAKNIQAFEATDVGKTIAYEYSTASKMPQVFGAKLDGNTIVSPMQLTKLNENLVKNREFTKTETIHWKGSNNEDVEGILYYPTNYDSAKKYPLITAIHGGPMGSDKDFWNASWAYPIPLLTQRGTFILRPNYHGSNNYGLKWAESICCGKYYDLETPDINMGVDYLISKGLVDPDKIATLGWSNGSILSTSLLVTYPARYKVASVGAGDIEWISDWGNVDFGDSFDSYYFGKSPFEDPQLYLKKSPFFKLDTVEAPVLIFHGTADTNVPPAQSWSYFRALQFHGKVPVKFVVFPGEPHGPRKLTHQLRKVDEEIAWFDRYFFNAAPPANEALKSGSPLDGALKSKSIARTGGLYGATYAGKGKPVIIPEVVKRDNLEIGRFEITRAQFVAFDKNYKMEPGTENYPANGITFEQAKSYADWLSKLTGQVWRVPTEAEVKSLYGNKDGENTLDYWAGYSPNPDDTVRLSEKLKDLPGPARLLKQVGSFPGQGSDTEQPAFDLGGNVAEWVVTSDGKGKPIGGSAGCPSDPRSNCTPAGEYIGFRVVRGAVQPASVAAKPAV